MTRFTVIATVTTVFASSKAEDKRPYAHLQQDLGGYVSLWPKANNKEALKTWKQAKMQNGKSYCFENVGLHDSNVIVYGATKISEI